MSEKILGAPPAPGRPRDGRGRRPAEAPAHRDTFRPIEHRLPGGVLSGAAPSTPGAITPVHRPRRGVPRVITLVGDRARTAAHGARVREAPAAAVREPDRNPAGAPVRAELAARGSAVP